MNFAEALARWIVLNAEDCSDRTKSHLHMLIGRVHTAQGNFDGAKPEYANSIYYSSRYFGAESISTAIGYFRLGDVFLAEGNVESALAFFDKVVDIWFKYLTRHAHGEFHETDTIARSVFFVAFAKLWLLQRWRQCLPRNKNCCRRPR